MTEMHYSISMCRSDILSWFGADKHPDGSLAVEALPEETFHFRERPKKHQVSIYGKQFLPHFEASHLTEGYDRTGDNPALEFDQSMKCQFKLQVNFDVKKKKNPTMIPKEDTFSHR